MSRATLTAALPRAKCPCLLQSYPGGRRRRFRPRTEKENKNMAKLELTYHQLEKIVKLSRC